MGEQVIKESITELEQLSESAQAACALLKNLSNPDRLLLLCELARQERNVGQLEQILGIAQPTLSQQLAVLREARLVDTRREGKHVYYRIASGEALAVLHVLHAQFCRSRAQPEPEALP